ncbi:thiamine pyrophosphokinase 1 [Oopsacas minuta]|uniref:Thiamine pyrophosphokinase 1 n=1 Tax=Oopsacas minuta TaxID=111878 RepID=A0AAV7KG35_9METZ|nr:thiamine pyrophosphokinase 1 [Oopsacas minuta]
MDPEENLTSQHVYQPSLLNSTYPLTRSSYTPAHSGNHPNNYPYMNNHLQSNTQPPPFYGIPEPQQIHHNVTPAQYPYNSHTPITQSLHNIVPTPPIPAGPAPQMLQSLPTSAYMPAYSNLDSDPSQREDFQSLIREICTELAKDDKVVDELKFILYDKFTQAEMDKLTDVGSILDKMMEKQLLSENKVCYLEDYLKISYVSLSKRLIQFRQSCDSPKKPATALVQITVVDMCRFWVSLIRLFRFTRSERIVSRRSSNKSINSINSLYPLRILSPDTETGESALILLNQPLHPSLTRTLFYKCTYRVCSDGGANRLYALSFHDLTPDQIVGDLDSVTHSVLQYYKDRGTHIVQDTGQDNTDLLKALLILPSSVSSVYILPPFTGRFDHVLACINSLYTWNNGHPSVPAYLISETTICFLLPAGRNMISFPPGHEDQFCGLVPIGEPASCVTTTGLRWNVKNEAFRFGALISTSNQFESNVVSVDTDKPLIFTSTYKYPPIK